MRTPLRLISLLAGCAAIAEGFWSHGNSRAAFFFLVLAAIWVAALRSHWKQASSLGLLISLAGAAVETWAGVPLAWGLAGLTGAFIAWDLTFYAPTLPFHAPDENPETLELRHLAKLAFLTALSLGIGSVNLLSRGALPLLWDALLLLYAAWIAALLYQWRIGKTARRL